VLTARVPDGGELPGMARIVADYAAVADRPAAAPQRRLLLSLPMTELLTTLRALQARPGVTVDHLYDY
jgi:hypothetical protein